MSHIRNDEISVPVIGAAVYRNQIVYLSAGGFKTALKSIWATLVAPKRELRGEDIGYHLNRRQAGYTVPMHVPIPESAMTKMVLLAHEANLSQADAWRSLDKWEGDCFLLALDPRGVGLDRYDDYKERGALHDERLPELYTKLAGVLDAHHSFPVKREWGEYLWKQGKDEHYASLLDDIGVYGDCVAGYKIAVENHEWLEYIQQGLKTGAITI